MRGRSICSRVSPSTFNPILSREPPVDYPRVCFSFRRLNCRSVRNAFADGQRPDGERLMSYTNLFSKQNDINSSDGLSTPFANRRLRGQLVNGMCVKCECHNHADTCSEYDGRCEDCKDNTMGAKCDECKPGYFGDPRRKTSGDCLK